MRPSNPRSVEESLRVHVENEQSNLVLDADRVAPIVEAVLELEGSRAEEASIRFVDATTIGELHDRFFNDPTETDCISIPMDDPEVLGDVIVCPKVALDYSAEHGTNPLEETTLYLVHGLLHLLGYDDIEDEEREAMRRAETRHMEHLKKRDLML